jgi:hypothetical protein
VRQDAHSLDMPIYFVWEPYSVVALPREAAGVTFRYGRLFFAAPPCPCGSQPLGFFFFFLGELVALG